ncbi:uncharacterized protein LOC110815792 isoform X2 [Carica papaya]|uniref:uncharacterized protein LOC110815792 isoform X2 n=1 Tax=Carica papaya TaxID=3649 RepID=UPI000B8CFE0E|nr:uncharacterized protein LOC110815792 isoform X2 [Carica papaya]
MEVRGSRTWRDELASLVEDTGIRFSGESIGISEPTLDAKGSDFVSGEVASGELELESFKEQVTGFLKSWGEMLLDLGRGCKDIVQQSIVTEDSFIVQKLSKPVAKISDRLKFLNEFLPEDRDPVHAWPVIFFVVILALAVLGLNTKNDSSIHPVKKIRIHPPSASHVLLPDGRKLAYQELGVPATKARFSLIAPHSFLSSRLAGIPGVKISLLEEFGVRLVTYDLPGFGESDPHPSRNLSSSALDMLYLADAIQINGQFWVLGYSSGSMHVWAALRYIASRIAGAALFAPMLNPYDPSMTKEETRRTWEGWLPRRKLMYFLARRFPKLLNFFYQQSFLSGKHGRLDEWFPVSLSKKDEILVEEPVFEEFWHRDVEESIRQGNMKPFIEEAVLQVSSWGFNLADLQPQQKCQRKGLLPWLRSMYTQPECELAGFLGPIHIWQGMEDQVVPPSMSDYISRVLPGAIIHKRPNEGHYSYYCFCDECHRQIFSTLFGSPHGSLEMLEQISETTFEETIEASTQCHY